MPWSMHLAAYLCVSLPLPLLYRPSEIEEERERERGDTRGMCERSGVSGRTEKER